MKAHVFNSQTNSPICQKGLGKRKGDMMAVLPTEMREMFKTHPQIVCKKCLNKINAHGNSDNGS